MLNAAQVAVNVTWAAGWRMRELFRPQAALAANDVEGLARAIEQALGGPSWSGVSVSPEQAMESPAVWIPVRVIGESMMQLPFNLLERDDNGRRRVAEEHPVQRLLGQHGKPNSWQSAKEFRELMVRWAAYRGNGYAVKVSVNGQLRELLPVHPRRVTPEQDDQWRLQYRIARKNGTEVVLPASEVFHLRGPGDDGLAGDDVVRKLRQAIALAVAQEKFAAKVFGNGARLAGVLETDNQLTNDEVIGRLRTQFEEIYSGLENAHKTAILEDGLKYKQVSQSNEDAQLTDSRKLQRAIVAAILRVPPHMVGDLDKATFGNIEDLARQFVDYALTPWAERWEGTVESQLLTDEERGRLQPKLSMQALLRGNAKDRAQFHAQSIFAGWRSRNEVRELEDMDRGPDELDGYLEPENMRLAGEKESDSGGRDGS